MADKDTSSQAFWVNGETRHILSELLRAAKDTDQNSRLRKSAEDTVVEMMAAYRSFLEELDNESILSEDDGDDDDFTDDEEDEVAVPRGSSSK